MNGRIRDFALALCMLLCLPTWAAQSVAPAAPVVSQPEAPQDSLGRDTPRGTVLGFLIAARTGQDERVPKDTEKQGR